MQEMHLRLSRGTILRGRYVVMGALARGEFSSLYLVNDKQDNQKSFALKELRNLGRKEQPRILAEARMLKRLQHPALPDVHDLFSEGTNGPIYILFDYIKGSDLETLQLEQPEQRFSLPQIVTLIAPIVEAVIYLHNQRPPIIHGNIKPSNIIVPESGTRTVLVNLGFAQEYDANTSIDDTRQDVSAYRAPEQYSKSGGISQGTDIYALGAILYTLFTGTVPADALARSKNLREREPDPLVPVHQITPTIPAAIADVIQRAMSIGSNERFSTVEQFWEALWQVMNIAATPTMLQTTEPIATQQIKESTGSNADTTSQQVTESVIESLDGGSRELDANAGARQVPYPDATLVASPPPPVLFQKDVTTPVPVPLQAQPQDYGSKNPGRLSRILLTLAVILLIGAGVGTGAWLFTEGHHSPRSAPSTFAEQHKPTPQSTASPNSRATPTLVTTAYPRVSRSYSGTIYDIPANVTTRASLTGIQQQQQSVSGSFIGLGISGPIKGAITTTNRIQFAVMGNAGQTILSFDGFMQPDGAIAGTYCSLDQAGKCSDYGLWSLTPAAS